MKDLAMLDILSTTDWKRPIYMSMTALVGFEVDLTPYAVREGNTYRILPVRNPDPERYLVNTRAAYHHIVHDFRFRGLEESGIYYSEDYRRAVQNHRNTINEVAEALIEENNPADAKKLLLFGLDKMPDAVIRYDVTQLDTIRLLFQVGERTEANEISDTLGGRAVELAAYYSRSAPSGNDFMLQLFMLRELSRIHYFYGDSERGKRFGEGFSEYSGALTSPRRNM